MISYPTPSYVESLRYASTSGQILHRGNWCPKTVPSAMWPGYRGGRPTPIKRAAQTHQRDHAYHSSAKLGSHQQSRYYLNVRFAMGTTPSLQLYRWLLFKSYRCLNWTAGTCSSWWHFDCGAGEIVADGAYISKSLGLMVLCRHIVVLAKYLVANERWQSLIGGCKNDRWPNDTC